MISVGAPLLCIWYQQRPRDNNSNNIISRKTDSSNTYTTTVLQTKQQLYQEIVWKPANLLNLVFLTFLLCGAFLSLSFRIASEQTCCTVLFSFLNTTLERSQDRLRVSRASTTRDMRTSCTSGRKTEGRNTRERQQLYNKAAALPRKHLRQCIPSGCGLFSLLFYSQASSSRYFQTAW